jgi:hypothetical protein
MTPPNSGDQRIAVLGWGSLISNPDGDASIGQRPLRIAGKFCPGGPLLPLEFSRIAAFAPAAIISSPLLAAFLKTSFRLRQFQESPAGIP